MTSHKDKKMQVAQVDLVGKLERGHKPKNIEAAVWGDCMQVTQVEATVSREVGARTRGIGVGRLYAINIEVT